MEQEISECMQDLNLASDYLNNNGSQIIKDPIRLDMMCFVSLECPQA